MVSSRNSGRKRSASSSTGEDDFSGLQVESISGAAENGLKHHTDEYESDALVIRRGQSFSLEIQIKSPHKPENNFIVKLETGKKPKKRSRTLLIAELKTEHDDKNDCYYQITQQKDNMLHVDVNIPSNALVSQYKMVLVATVKAKGKKRTKEFVFPKDVFILFNSWCEDDEVYMENEDLKKEYVSNDSGYVYWSGRRAKPWFFGQFTDTVLRCTFKLLMSTYSSRRDTVREVARHMSARANSFDNNGLLEGNWSGDYDGGVKPWKWNGSVKICRQYLATGKPVKFGQCWVFSGLVTSLMRCLGVPARSVTNYDSAHDTDNNCTFDKYFDKDMNYLDEESDDSCWNFHVWNDVWMTRPDLPEGFGGWQAIDGTPQEESKNIYRCGPASLLAIKEGNVHYGYDTRFVFAEVNAEKVYWQRDDEGDDWVPVRFKKDSVGHFISTKKPNEQLREDITDQYKYKDGSLLERAAVYNALKRSRNPALRKQPSDVKFKSTLPREVLCDAGVDFVVNAKNNSSRELEIDTVVTAQLVRYNGVSLKKLEKQSLRKTVAPNGDVDFKFHYDPVEYREDVDENVTIRLSYMSRVVQTKQIYVSQKTCDINKPELQVSLVSEDKKIKPGDEVAVNVVIPSACNILKYSDCTIELDGPLLAEEQIFNLNDCVSDGTGKVEKKFVVKKSIKKSRSLELIVTFNSKELSGITGTLDVSVVV